MDKKKYDKVNEGNLYSRGDYLTPSSRRASDGHGGDDPSDPSNSSGSNSSSSSNSSSHTESDDTLYVGDNNRDTRISKKSKISKNRSIK